MYSCPVFQIFHLFLLLSVCLAYRKVFYIALRGGSILSVKFSRYSVNREPGSLTHCHFGWVNFPRKSWVSFNYKSTNIVGAIVLGVIAIICFVFSYLQFNEKGFLFNNAYIYASKQERKNMDKKPHYKQSGIVFLLIGIIFLINTINIIGVSQ